MEKSQLLTSIEKRWVLAFAMVVMLVTSIPYLIGYSAEGDIARFSGFVIAVEDGNSYIAKMLSGATGSWLFRTPYTAFPQSGALMFFPYILLGKLAASPAIHEQLVAIFHLYRVVAGGLAILATYDFLSFYIMDLRYRWLGLILIILGGGLGWLVLLVGDETWLGSLPLDFYSPETFGFLALFGLPHLAMSRALLLWTLLIYLHASRASSNYQVAILPIAIKMSLLWFVSGLFQPLVMAVVGIVIAIHLLTIAAVNFWNRSRGQNWDWKRWLLLCRLVLVSGILPGLLILYNLWVLWSDPFIAGWTQQNLIKSPHPLHYLLAYGVLIPLAWIGTKRLMSLSSWQGWLLVGWLIVLPLLAYTPVNLQRRLPEGIWVAWVTVSMVGLEQVLTRDRRPTFRYLWPVILLCLTLPSTLIIWLGGMFTAGRVEFPVFRPRDEIAVFEFLREEAFNQEVVLSAYETGNALPAWAPLRVVIGHGPESVNLSEVRPKVTAFYSSDTQDSQRLSLLNQHDVSYVFWGPAERQLGDWNPLVAPYLKPLHQVGDFSIFKYESTFIDNSIQSTGDE